MWGDWSNVEAWLVPWLTGTDDAEKKLDIFREFDRGPSLPDVYVRTAGALLGKTLEQSLGVGGGLDALWFVREIVR